MKKNTKNPPFGAAIYTENTFSSTEEPEILSLDALRAAFTGLNNETEKNAESEIIQEEPEYDEYVSEETEHFTENVKTEHPDCSAEISPQTIIEAILFVGNTDNKPFKAEKIAEKMRNVAPEEIRGYIEELNEKYRISACPYHIIEEESGYRMVLREEFDSVRTGFYGKIREVRLSQAAIDTLAAVAYRQPISAEEVQKLRKQPGSALLLQLVNRGLLETKTKIQNGKKVLLYQTTKRFLELFQLESLDDLPIFDDIFR